MQMGSAGGSDAEAAYATAAAGATSGQVAGDDDVFYSARVHAVLDVVRHEAAGNRELLNTIIQVHSHAPACEALEQIHHFLIIAVVNTTLRCRYHFAL